MPNAITSLFDPALFDPGAFAIVVAGTVLACAARSGWRDFGAALRQAGMLVRRGLDQEANRKALALALTAIQRDGVHRASPVLPPDRALGLMLETYLRHGTLDALHRARQAEAARKGALREAAARVFCLAGELGPVFGLIGTLYGFTRLAPMVGADAATLTMAAVSSAVLSTLYGALLAHLLCFPLASAIERRGLDEDGRREALAEWFVAQLGKHLDSAREQRAHLRGVA